MKRPKGFSSTFWTFDFRPGGTGTSVGWRQVFDTSEHRDHIAPLVLEANEQNLDRLEAEVRNVP